MQPFINIDLGGPAQPLLKVNHLLKYFRGGKGREVVQAVDDISFDIESNSLALIQSLETVRNDSGEMYEYILAALVVGNEAEALICVKPFYCTFAHVRYLLKNFNKF